MSGGSYDYAYSKFEMGDVTAVLRHVPKMIERLDVLLAALQAGEVEMYEKVEGTAFAKSVPMPPTEIRIVAVAAQCAKLQHALATAQAAEKAVREIGGYHSISYAIEWRDSGDWGADQVVDTCVELLHKSLGLEPPKER